jgi:type III pantothenate kinase
MVLAFNIANRHIIFGGFEAEQGIRFVSKIATDDRKTEEQYAVDLRDILQLYNISLAEIQGAVISSVVPALSPIIRGAIELLTDCAVILVSTGVKTGLNIKTDNPKQLGSDIVCGAVWAKNAGKIPAILVDLGTATTVTAIDRNGVLIGYGIMPGMGISLQALREHAAQLPSIGIDCLCPKAIGKNTVDAMTAGIFYGSAGAVDGMISHFQEEMEERKPHIVLTGEYAQTISPFLKNAHEIDFNIILKGLWDIWKKNQK